MLSISFHRGAARAALALAALCTFSACRARARAPAGEGGVRLVSLHDVTTEALVRMGAVARLVGVAELVSPAVGVSAAVASVPRVASAESILALAPTVVVGLAVVAEQDPELVVTLRARGVEVYLGRPQTLDQVYQLVREVGRLARAEPGAERAIAAADALAAADAPAAADALAAAGALEAAGALAPAPPSHPIRPPLPSAGEGGREGAASAPPTITPRPPARIFVYDGGDPPFTAGGQTVLSDLIARAGARNLFADLPAGWTHVSWEQVVARAPTHLVIDDYLPAGGDATGKDRARAVAVLARKRATLASLPRLAGLPVLELPLGLVLGGLGSGEAIVRLRALVAGSAG